VLAATVALGACGVWLVAVCWRRRSVLALLCGVCGIGGAVLVGAAGWAGSAGTDALVGSLTAVTIGTVLLVLGQAVERLLDQDPDESV
jgi:hypothetical protein